MHRALIALIWASITATSVADTLPERAGPAARTTGRVPHIQIDAVTNADLNTAMLERINAIPDVEIQPTRVSLPGAVGFWLRDGLELAREDVIVGGREFAHMHPDGSLHASLPPALASHAIEQGWAESHPWSTKRPGWDGFVMIFTPRNTKELETVLELVIASYNFVTGRSYAPED